MKNLREFLWPAVMFATAKPCWTRLLSGWIKNFRVKTELRDRLRGLIWAGLFFYFNREVNLMRGIRAILGLSLVVIVFGGVAATAQTGKMKKLSIIDQAKAYCTSTGGVVELRQAVYGTNNPQQDWLWLTGEESFCQYTLAADGSRIHLSLQTLFSTKPTLAALAYYAEVPWNGQGNGNPASYYCTQLGGAEIGATDLAGGGWVSAGGIDQVLEACVFPDNSTIDSWGLFYHSDNIIRGIDLSTVLKYANPYAGKK